MKDLILSIFNIFKYTGKVFTILRNLIFNLLLFVVLVIVVVSLIPKEAVQIPSESILRLNISGDIVEEKRMLSSFERFLGDSITPDGPEPETLLQDILDIIDRASEDERISVLLLNLQYIGKAGLNQMETIGQALEQFKKSGKKVVAAEDYYTQSQYFLASFADKIIVNPMGGVDLHGFGVYRLYFKDALERLEINYNIFKVGTYKSALEPFTRNSMSSEDQQQNELWLSALWQVYTDEIMRLRHLSKEDIHFYTNNISEALNRTKGNPAQLALESGLVDQVWSRPQVTSYLGSLTKKGSNSPHIISSSNYFDSISPSFENDNSAKPQIGLIVAEGNILPGKQPPGLIGGDSLAALIKKARKNDAIKGLVLRINSGGGSAFASEIIRQELLELKESGKPIIVSMGTVAASGGYWIAADADEIWASKATITGSIGIFGAIPTFEKTLATVGIYSDGTGTTPLAAGLNLTQPLPEQIKAAIQQTIVYNYDQFLQIVAKGRDIEKTRVEELAQGRVYDGISAQRLGLIDKIGSLDDAIQAAAKLADLNEYSTEYIRPPISVKEQFLRLLTSKFPFSAEFFLKNHPIAKRFKNIFANHMDEFLLFNDPQHIYAHCLINMTL